MAESATHKTGRRVTGTASVAAGVFVFLFDRAVDDVPDCLLYPGMLISGLVFFGAVLWPCLRPHTDEPAPGPESPLRDPSEIPIVDKLENPPTTEANWIYRLRQWNGRYDTWMRELLPDDGTPELTEGRLPLARVCFERMRPELRELMLLADHRGWIERDDWWGSGLMTTPTSADEFRGVSAVVQDVYGPVDERVKGKG